MLWLVTQHVASASKSSSHTPRFCRIDILHRGMIVNDGSDSYLARVSSNVVCLEASSGFSLLVGDRSQRAS